MATSSLDASPCKICGEAVLYKDAHTVCVSLHDKGALEAEEQARTETAPADCAASDSPRNASPARATPETLSGVSCGTRCPRIPAAPAFLHLADSLVIFGMVIAPHPAPHGQLDPALSAGHWAAALPVFDKLVHVQCLGHRPGKSILSAPLPTPPTATVQLAPTGSHAEETWKMYYYTGTAPITSDTGLVMLRCTSSIDGGWWLAVSDGKVVVACEDVPVYQALWLMEPTCAGDAFLLSPLTNPSQDQWDDWSGTRWQLRHPGEPGDILPVPTDSHHLLNPARLAHCPYFPRLRWRATFLDGFSSLSDSLWAHEEGPPWANNELQFYMKECTDVVGGKMVITARPAVASDGDQVSGHKYVSGRVTSRDTWTPPVLVLVRARIPKGQGLWPAIWMLPPAEGLPDLACNLTMFALAFRDNVPFSMQSTSQAYGGWASCGEIDVMETRNMEDTYTSTLHFGGEYPRQVSSRPLVSPSTPGFFDAPHTFGVEWQEEGMVFWLDAELGSDGRLSGGHCMGLVPQDAWWCQKKDSPIQCPPAPFDHCNPMRIIINMAVGGTFTGGAEPLPDWDGSCMEVHWVKVYDQMKEDQ
eukprot:gene528-376_t